ncbi:uncharacterized protein B0I36DRAFT_367908 [Microdochium trichocladiopsis]|uniref:Uncharacterized protein n=1 Tax=Microdochium trichocladiopsis TaxID=1682393 RepID=A0A9P9BLA6_9PEZI|nr:uncharacterized protein B0I36DRAFT_367908 [Microdochium trichocladiopsis]KAH7021507.1 hypothetical protein B0I36DRAFT_367908 [Microdochium trichocladiopsis]
MASKTMQNLGPLTSIWTPPVACYNTVLACLSLPCSSGYPAQTCESTAASSLLWVHWAVDCFPPYPSTFDLWGYYSPGVFCPDGFTIAATQVGDGIGVAASGALPLDPTQTGAVCCPTVYSYDYINNGDQRCVRKLTGRTAFAAQICGVTIQNVQMNLPTTYHPTTANGVGPVVTVTTNDFFWPAVRIVWQESDLSLIDDAAASGMTASPSAAVSAIASPTANGVGPVVTVSPNPKSGGLSPGAIAGIVAGIVVALALLVLAVWLILRHRRRAQRERHSTDGIISHSNVTGLRSEQLYPDYQHPQQQQQYYAAPGFAPEAELSGEGRVRYELPAWSDPANIGR